MAGANIAMDKKTFIIAPNSEVCPLRIRGHDRRAERMHAR